MKQPESRLILDYKTGKPLYGVGAGTVGTFLEAYYPEAQELIRVATGYFRLKGYNIGRSYLTSGRSIQFRILVGTSEERNVQLAVRDEIERELKTGKGIYAPIVRELIRRIKNNEFIIFDARAMQVDYHCKFYICDQQTLIHGSGNYTGYGLLTQHEQASATNDSEAIKDFSEWFNEATLTAKDVTKPILKVLEDWLKLADPFHAYLKFLAALDLFFDRENVPGLLLPVYYQQRMIARAVEHIEAQRAAIILAATGLGKTIIGAELAFQLKRLQLIDDLIVIAPSGVHSEWKKHLKPRSFHDVPFGTNLLFMSEAEHSYYKVYELDKRLHEATSRTLILIDEAHTYRNQDRADWQKNEKPYRDEKRREEIRGSVALDRLRPVVNEKGATIVLLTATPYGTNPKNIESLLRFLPIGLFRKEDRPHPSKPMTMDELAELPFVTSLGLQQVLTLAKARKDEADGRVFVQFGEQDRYMPKTVYLHRVDYELPFYADLCAAFDGGLFAQKELNVTDNYIEEKEKYGTRVIDFVQGQLITAWLGSPPVTAECLWKNINTLSHRDKQAQAPSLPLFPGYQPYTLEEIANLPSEANQKEHGYETTMREDWKRREPPLRRLHKQLSELTQDNKVTKLLSLLRKHVIENREKVIVFVERHATAIFIEEFLKANVPEIAVGCTVAMQGKDGFTLNEDGPRKEILDNFSPISRNVKASDITAPTSVLICTDANGIGINLQDANIVINYDPADSADILFQRAGRIIRFTVNPNRCIYIYTFKPVCDSPASSKACEKIEQVFDSMRKHHSRSQRIFGLSLLPENADEIIDLTNPEQEAGFADSFNMAKDSSLDDPLFMHTAIFDKHRDTAKNLKDGFYSSMVYKEEDPRVAVLIEYEQQKHIILYNLKARKLEFENKPIPILKYIACEPTKENAPVDLSRVERVTKNAVRAWLKKLPTNKDAHEPTIVCGFYLSPRLKKPFAKALAFILLKKERHKKKR